jgi:hypothetical protein
MNDVADPAASDPVPEVNPGALSPPAPPPDVDLAAWSRREPASDVDPEALTRPPELASPPDRRRVIFGALAAVVVVGLAGGGLWWRREVTAGPGLELQGGRNVFRDEGATDRSGIGPRRSVFPSDVDQVEVAFERNGRLFVHVGLFNGGRHDVRIGAVPGDPSYYWGLDRMSLAADPGDGDHGVGGVAPRYEPFRPFTLQRGETRHVRLELRLADCDPASFQPGGYSTLLSVGMRYRTLGITRTAHVPFRDTEVDLQAMGICAHPLNEHEWTQ